MIYSSVAENYRQQWRQQRNEIILPPTTLHRFPRNGNEGLYGWTRRDGIINVREDLQGEKRMETIIHESIHTTDEYETRRLTEWIMESLFPSERRYTQQKKYLH